MNKMNNINKLKKCVLTLLFVFAVSTCKNDFTDKAVTDIKGPDLSPPLLIWQTDTVLLNETGSAKISPAALNLVLNSAGRKVGFNTSGVAPTVGPMSDYESTGTEVPPFTLGSVTYTPTTASITLPGTMTYPIDSFTLTFDPANFTGADKGTVGSPESSFKVKTAGDIEFLQSLLDFASLAANPIAVTGSEADDDATNVAIATAIYNTNTNTTWAAYTTVASADDIKDILTRTPSGTLSDNGSGDYAVSFQAYGKVDNIGGTVTVPIALTLNP
ncbi:MAG: hypothetical protein Ta2B_27270 [Termitinemataceae bacterium]|nr:MAG: hypothetical protein Ta2B_27270 [Termitinemataceae bacterium]